MNISKTELGERVCHMSNYFLLTANGCLDFQCYSFWSFDSWQGDGLNFWGTSFVQRFQNKHDIECPIWVIVPLRIQPKTNLLYMYFNHTLKYHFIFIFWKSAPHSEALSWCIYLHAFQKKLSPMAVYNQGSFKKKKRIRGR